MINLALPPEYSFSRFDGDKMAELDRAWENQCVRFTEVYSDYAASSLGHARMIASEASPERRYGVFGLQRADGDIEVIVHVNHAALPGTTGHTLRVLWALMAPKYDFEAITADDLSNVISGVMIGIVLLGRSEMSSRHIKFHLGSMPDRGILSGMGRVLESVGIIFDVAVRGNWLHMSLVEPSS